MAVAVEGAWRTCGHSKDHRPDLPQVVIGMAVTREGIPVRVWTFPGNTSDQLFRTVKDDLAAWQLNRVIWALDRGFTWRFGFQRGAMPSRSSQLGRPA